ncbi:endonuclease/exonuclease/phosphatase family protein [Winogradskyella vidalii]|uniref:endonuclease/exonuclease/phosphatase family protein n=1 Tax=Winogradskyella vidalii TaxID=2615024 RepID=UPI0015CD0609|nr:endonuclease/exonuclease/phosphatase family protein [Winogradskyella vidalii]
MIKTHPKAFILFILVVAFTSISKGAIATKHNLKNSAHLRDTIHFNDKTSNTLKISSWNIRDLGRTKDDKELLEIANIIKEFDLVAIQEVVAKDPAGAQAVAKIADELNRMGFKWDYRISNPTKSPSVYISERYAFLWKTSKVNLIGRTYLDSELEDTIHREPYIGKFHIKNETQPFYAINFHSRKHNDNPEDEIIFFKEYTKRLHSDHIVILGDFNLSETHDVWNNFYNTGYKSALKNTKTTLKIKCRYGNYLNHPIDNIYYAKGITAIDSGSKDFVGSCDNLEASRTLSDHLPVFLEFKNQ